MIRIVYHRKYHRVTVTGHAQSGEPGHDLVCAAASILCYTLANAVARAAEIGHARNPVTILSEGESEISCVPQRKYGSVITLILDNICAGFEILSHQYGENISYEVRGI